MKTVKLQHLYITPQFKDVKWIELIIECAPKLSMLKSLTINSCVNIDAQGGYKPVEEEKKDTAHWLNQVKWETSLPASRDKEKITNDQLQE